MFIAICLIVIIAELGFLIYILVGGGALPWMVDTRDGVLHGQIAAPRHHRTLAAKIEYMLCYSRYQLELEQQRFRIAQGLPADAGELDFSASPDELRG